MEVLREWLEKTAAAIVAVLSEEHHYYARPWQMIISTQMPVLLRECNPVS
jgi:hypothetical protein